MALRIEPKVKPFDPDKYAEIKAILTQAQAAAMDAYIFWDLDEDEDPSRTRKDFLYVAEREQMSVVIRRRQGSRSLRLLFNPELRKRISAQESRDRMVAFLRRQTSPVSKTEILEGTGLGTATWNLRIRELTQSGQVKRIGNRRTTTYCLTD
jgi:predicted transcriptional regulator